jgi:RNA polymerase sigma-70 factor, ECF subfamily
MVEASNGENSMKKVSHNMLASQFKSLSDLALLERVLAHDEVAWRELLLRFRSLIFRCITKVLCRYESVLSNEDINEIYSEVCFNLLRNDMKKLRLYDPARGSKLGSWIGLLSINTAYDHLRVTARQPILDRIDGLFEREDELPGPLEELIERERRNRLARLAADFSHKDQHFMELYYGRGMAPTEIALKMNISVKTVYSKKNKIESRLAALAHTVSPDALAA